MKDDSRIPLSYRTPDDRGSVGRLWIAVAIFLLLVVVGFWGYRWDAARRAEAAALSAQRQLKLAPLTGAPASRPYQQR